MHTLTRRTVVAHTPTRHTPTRRIAVAAGCVILLCAGMTAFLLMNRPVAGRTSSTIANGQNRVINPKARLHGRALPPARPGEIRLPAVGADMMPPTDQQAAAARVSSAAARATANREAALPGLVTGHSTVRLMVYSNTHGPVAADGTMPPSVLATLSWIITFSGSAPFISPPIDYTGKMPDLTCQYVAVISAVNGRQVDAYQTCEPVTRGAGAGRTSPGSALCGRPRRGSS
jgi:hypothetical protein